MQYRRLFAVAALLVSQLVAFASAASMVEVTNFGSNPGALKFYLYVPDRRASNPPIVVGIHCCGGNAAYAKGVGNDMVTLADQKGFIMIFPEVTRSGACYDVSSAQSLSHNGGGDATSIVSMVNYVLRTYNGDATRVYSWGFSSGAMMTNVLLGSYPEVFAAGAALMGVPFYCFYTGSVAGWNGACSGGSITHTGAEWAQYAHNAYPAYTGAYPRMQLFHGTTDTTLNYHNFGEEIKQWTTLNGVSATAAFTDYPKSGWTRTRYGGTDAHAKVEAISVAGEGHTLPLAGMISMINVFFGLDQGGIPHPTNGQPTSCSAPANPANGKFTCAGTMCTAVCNAGYAATGTGYATCTNNVWTTLPACVPTGSGSAACNLASENNALALSCASGSVINAVEFASFGTPTGDCSASALGSCHAINSLSVMQDSCVGKASCSVNAANSVFGDPCSGTGKQLAVRARCAAATTVCATAGEWNSLTLACPSGKNLVGFSFASFGTPSGACGSNNFAKGSCHAASTLDVVQKACAGKNSCAFSAPMINTFGDPCSGTGKTLAVQALCA